jgi:hypothetical protein
MLPTPVPPVSCIILTLALVAALLATAAAEDAAETRIPHLDGTGTATVVEIERDVPGAAHFVGATPGPVPRPGELIVPTRTVAPSPSATPTN